MKNIPVYIEKQYLGVKCVYKLESVARIEDKSTHIEPELMIEDDFDVLCDLLFIKDESNILTSKLMSESVYNLVELSKTNSMIESAFLNDVYNALYKCGFTRFNSLKELTASRLWVDFKKFICNKYNVKFKNNNINGKTAKSVKCLRLKELY